MPFIEDTIKSEVVYNGPIFKVRKHIVNSVAGESVRDVLEHSGGVVMIALTGDCAMNGLKLKLGFLICLVTFVRR